MKVQQVSNVAAKRSSFALNLIALCAVALPGLAVAQFGPPPGPPKPAKEAAQIAKVDFTGYWVSLVTEDWRYRMFTAPKGDFPEIPLNPVGMKEANSWNPSQDLSFDCKLYGAAHVMRMPTRLHITWADDETLKIETDLGVQTRLLRFKAPPPPDSPASLQGYSAANWDTKTGIKVLTTHMLPGYLQSNGVPYSDKATMTEYIDAFKEDNGDEWLVVKSVIEDPQYLRRSYVLSTHFKKQKDAKGWNPTPCK